MRLSLIFLTTIIPSTIGDVAYRELRGGGQSTTVIADIEEVGGEETGAISVTGYGKVSGPPDMATVITGVSTEAENARDALTRNSEAMERIVQVLKDSYDIDGKDIQTTGFSLSPQYDYNERPPVMTGYRVNNNVRVSIRELDMLGGLLDAVTTAGSNQLSGITFGFSDMTNMTNTARQEAVKDAAERATLYATEAGVTLGNILSIREPGSPVPPDRYAASDMESAASTSSVPVQSGELEVTASIHIIYALLTE